MSVFRFVLIVYCCFTSYFSFGQDVYSYNSSKLFGEYLLKSGQFELATKEFERLVFMNKSDDSLKLNLLKAYRLAGKPELAFSKFNQLFTDKYAVNNLLAIEYSKVLMQQRNWSVAEDFWTKNTNLTPDDKTYLKSTVNIFEGKFKKAKVQLADITEKENFMYVGYNELLDKGLGAHRKSPGGAAILSALIPGLGKVYANNWKDGLISFIFTLGMSYQSYRNFDKFGTNNARGWIYGGIASGFYLGNIYGSAKSAKDYNKKKINVLQHEASDLFNSKY